MTQTERSAGTFADAEKLYRDGHYDRAADVLRALLETDPADTTSRFALAMALTGGDHIADAVAEFQRVVADEPAHQDAWYRLGCLHQYRGEDAAAVSALRRALGVGAHPDAAARLAALAPPALPVTAVPAMTPALSPALTGSIVPGPAPLRRVIEDHAVADRGRVMFTVRQEWRYVLPFALGVGLRSLVVAALLTLAAVTLMRLPADWRSALDGISSVVLTVPHWALPLPAAAVFVLAAVRIGRAVVEARLRESVFYERGIDLAGGLLRRDRHFVWYYQLAEEPRYSRSFVMLLTHTASLHLLYNNSSTTTQWITLAGVGSPAQVMEIRQYIQERRTAERATMRGFLV